MTSQIRQLLRTLATPISVWARSESTVSSDTEDRNPCSCCIKLKGKRSISNNAGKYFYVIVIFYKVYTKKIVFNRKKEGIRMWFGDLCEIYNSDGNASEPTHLSVMIRCRVWSHWNSPDPDKVLISSTSGHRGIESTLKWRSRYLTRKNQETPKCFCCGSFYHYAVFVYSIHAIRIKDI